VSRYDLHAGEPELPRKFWGMNLIAAEGLPYMVFEPRETLADPVASVVKPIVPLTVCTRPQKALCRLRS
jgi:hypothetical protein